MLVAGLFHEKRPTSAGMTIQLDEWEWLWMALSSSLRATRKVVSQLRLLQVVPRTKWSLSPPDTA